MRKSWLSADKHSEPLHGCRGHRLNWIDAVIFLLLAWFTYSAFNAGLIREIVTILGAIFAIALAGLFYLELAEDVRLVIDNEQTAEIVAFGIIFGAVILASQLIALFMKQTASFLMLGLFDSIGGAVIGLLKGFVFVEILLIIGITFESLGLERAINGSVMAPFFLDLLPVLRLILPGEFKSEIDSF
jgi:membrane protein required for colicin V production